MNRIKPITNFATQILITLCLLTLISCTSSKPEQTEPPKEKSLATEAANPQKLLEYEEVLTAGATDGETLPLVIAVHGLGGRPMSFRKVVENLPVKARVILPRAPTSWGPGYAWFTTRVASGDFDELAKGISRAAGLNAALLDHLIEKKKVRGRPIFLGFSQGGMISFAMALHHPKNLGLVIPISGLLPETLWPKEKDSSLKYPKIRALHGAQDSLVPLTPTKEAVAYLKSKGFDTELTEYEDVRHTINPTMKKELYRLVAEAINQM